MDKYQKKSIWSLGIAIATAITCACGTPSELDDIAISEESVTSGTAESSAPPQFRVDPYWPRPLPNNWMLGQVSGLDVSPDTGNIWIVHRPHTLDARQRGEEGMCCVPAPPVIEFAPDGNVLRSWGGPGDDYEWPESEHGIYIDGHNNVWIGGNGPTDSQILKFTSDGEFILQIGRAGQSGGSNDTDNLGRPAGFTIDENTNEIYVADGYGNRRIIVFDRITGAYKRHWGAYGETPHDEPLPAYDPNVEPSRQYRSPVHDVTISTDGLVYVADRTNNRLQLFQKDGTFVREVFIRPETLGSGSVSGVTLSEDLEQRWLFIPDGTNNVVWILNRSTLEIVGQFGRLGKYAGQFYRLHNLAIDPRGNLYTTEVNVGQRVQKFVRLRDF